MLTSQDREWHQRYDAAPPVVRDTVKDCFDDVADRLREMGFAAPMDDQAEALIAALTRYIVAGWVDC